MWISKDMGQYDRNYHGEGGQNTRASKRGEPYNREEKSDGAREGIRARGQERGQETRASQRGEEYRSEHEGRVAHACVTE